MPMQQESKDAKKLHEQRAFSYALVDTYRSTYLDPATKMVWAHFVEERSCPVCGSDTSIPIFNKNGITHVLCTVCTMVYTNPVLTEAALKKYYTELDTKQGDIAENESAFYREIYTKGLEAIERHKKGGAILDIGCSSGFFLDVARERSWETYGVEPGKKEGSRCQEKGHTLFASAFEDVRFDRTFDVITLWDVFEHIPDGKKNLGLLRDLVADEGVLFMQIPSADALAARIMREKCNMFDGLEHCNLYNPETITRLAESCGFEILEMKSVISEIAVMNNYLSYQDPYFGETRYENKKGLLGLLTDEFIHEHLLGYKLQIVLRKK